MPLRVFSNGAFSRLEQDVIVRFGLHSATVPLGDTLSPKVLYIALSPNICQFRSSLILLCTIPEFSSILRVILRFDPICCAQRSGPTSFCALRPRVLVVNGVIFDSTITIVISRAIRMYSFITTSGPALDVQDQFAVRSHNMRLNRKRQRERKRIDSRISLLGPNYYDHDSLPTSASSETSPEGDKIDDQSQSGPNDDHMAPLVEQHGIATRIITNPRLSSLSDDAQIDESRGPTLAGCKKCALTARDVARDRAVIAHIESTILCFRSPVAERVVGMNMWVEAMIPPSAWSTSVPACALGAWALPKCKSHEYGNDAVALLNIGCSKRDDKLTLAGRRLHFATIQTLRNDVACSSSNVQGIFAVLLDLMLASCYTVVSPGVTTWLNHLIGQTHLLKARLDEFKTPGFCTFLFLHYRQLNLIHCLVTRKRMPLAIGDWNIGDATPPPGSSETMYRLALKIPALLEITDRLVVSTDHNTDKAARAILALLQLERSLMGWLEAWIALQPSRSSLASNLTGLGTSMEPCDIACFEDGLVMELLW